MGDVLRFTFDAPTTGEGQEGDLGEIVALDKGSLGPGWSIVWANRGQLLLATFSGNAASGTRLVPGQTEFHFLERAGLRHLDGPPSLPAGPSSRQRLTGD